MTSLPALPNTDPTSLYRWRDGFYAADLLTAALVWLDLFSWLDEHVTDLAGICDAFRIHERPTDVMLTLFAAMGLVERDGELVRLTPLSREHLVSRSPFFLGPYYASYKERPVCKDFLTILQTGQPANWAAAAEGQDWAAAMADAAFASQFTAAMDSRGVYLGQMAASAVDLGSRRALLDIAGGSGVYASAFVAHHPHLRATVFEKPPVDAVARRAIAARGFGSRVDVVAGDMLAEVLPRGYDVHLISNVLHDWDVPRVRDILARSFDALEPGGLLLVHDSHLNADKTGPLPVAAYSALLMHATEGRCYSVTEMFTYLDGAGFSDPRLIDTAADRSVITATRRA